jgi:nucleotide-binding universal stress UspA family protein
VDLTDSNSDAAAGPVLVAVDFSSSSHSALRWAIPYCRGCGISLTLLHVVHDNAECPGKYTPSGHELGKEDMESVGERLLTDFWLSFVADHADLCADFKPQTLVVTGLPATRILEIADYLHAQHLVLGCNDHGRSASGVGTLSKRILKKITIPTTLFASAD